MTKKLQHTILLVLAFAFLLKDFVAVSYQVDYYLNQQKYLVKCVNKARPNLKCNGKCQLALKLKKIESDAKSDLNKHNNKQPFKFREFESYSLQTNFPSTKFAFNGNPNKISLVQYNQRKYWHYSSAIFHPPAC